ncbi:hypothetical protein AM587_10016089 [Phytophthora nicotianae]|uniref:FAR1 domain-containing protein n=1 Tax=Phytophthora nicotianae TaxID=4792 RepID=A0A0W8CGR9_PHYNI|nr:hypothetical protein AM587_10016089 [Phytophthora nicotianae]
MAEDRRVKTAVRRPQRRNLCVEINADADEASAASPGALSDEEWVDSATDSGSNTSGQSKQGRSGGMDHPRRLQDDNEDAQGLEVLVAPLERFEFDSWEDLESYLAEYTKGTHQSFRILTKNTVTAHNAKIRPTGSNKPLLPNEWVNYGKTYICTHSGTYKSRGKGKWKRLQSRAMECEAQINACVQVDDAKVPTFILRITSARLVHNHPVNKLTYNQYPHVRTALESDVVGTVNELRKAGAKKKRILKYMHDNTDLNPSTQDVSNLIRRLKAKENTASTSATRLKKWMKEFAKESGNVGRIFVDSVGEKYDKEMRFVAQVVSEHACELIYEQYEYAISGAKYKYYEPVPDMFLLQNESEDENALDDPAQTRTQDRLMY